jgi:hypothetical protein
MPCVGFEPTIPVFERAKRVHALDRVATVTGNLHNYRHANLESHMTKNHSFAVPNTTLHPALSHSRVVR